MFSCSVKTFSSLGMTFASSLWHGLCYLKIASIIPQAAHASIAQQNAMKIICSS
jgi:hypothetical protein